MGILLDLAKGIIEEATDELTSARSRRFVRDAGTAVAAGLAGAAMMRGMNKIQQNPTPAAYPQMPQNMPQPAPAMSQVAPAAPIFSFYAIIEGVRRGPYNEIQFKRLVENDLADANTMVWQEGMAEWLPAAKVKMMEPVFNKNSQQQSQEPAQPDPAMPQMPVQKTYYVNLNNQMVGPFTKQQLQQFVQTGEFTQQMYVWCEGMPEWLTAGNVEDLSSLFGPAMPQMPIV